MVDMDHGSQPHGRTFCLGLLGALDQLRMDGWMDGSSIITPKAAGLTHGLAFC